MNLIITLTTGIQTVSMGLERASTTMMTLVCHAPLLRTITIGILPQKWHRLIIRATIRTTLRTTTMSVPHAPPTCTVRTTRVITRCMLLMLGHQRTPIITHT